MSSVRSVAFSGAVAALIATGVILAFVFVPGVGLSSETTPMLQSSEGTMVVLLTDPPTVPENVSAVYIQFTRVQAHIANAGSNEGGWYNLTGSGEINLMSIVNVSQTIANSNLPAGRFNGLRFNVTEVTVSYSPNPSAKGPQNYTGMIVNGHNTLSIWIPGGINVVASQTAAALIDLTPTVVLVGRTSNPNFVFVPSTRGYVVPSSSIPAQSHSIGGKSDLKENSWWASVEASTRFGITSVLLSNSSLTIMVRNEGSSPVELRLAGVTTQTTMSGGESEGMLRTSDIFAIQSNGNLANLNTSSLVSVENVVSDGGWILAPGQSVSLTYNGPVLIGAQLQAVSPKYIPPMVLAGSPYVVWVEGSGQIAEAGTTAK
jgi:hypothetical protein